MPSAMAASRGKHVIGARLSEHKAPIEQSENQTRAPARFKAIDMDRGQKT
jgi:hypothetical protein